MLSINLVSAKNSLTRRKAIKPTISLLYMSAASYCFCVVLVYSFSAHSTGELLLRIMVEHASICVIELLASTDDSGYKST